MKKLSHLGMRSERADRGAKVGERRLKRRGARGRRRRHRRRVQVTRMIRRVRRVSRELGLVSESTPRRRRLCTSRNRGREGRSGSGGDGRLAVLLLRRERELRSMRRRRLIEAGACSGRLWRIDMEARSSPGGGPLSRRRLGEFRLLLGRPVPIVCEIIGSQFLPTRSGAPG